MHYHGDNTVVAFLYFIKTVLICILELLAPSWSIALYMAVYGGIDRIQACLTDELIELFSLTEWWYFTHNTY